MTVRPSATHDTICLMIWDAEAAIADFRTVTRLAGVDLPNGSITIEQLPAPHVPPTRLPSGKMAVYAYLWSSEALKIGKAGARSEARYTSRRYSPGSSMSNLSKSILADRERAGAGALDEASVGRWIKENVDRVNFLMDERAGVPVEATMKG